MATDGGSTDRRALPCSLLSDARATPDRSQCLGPSGRPIPSQLRATTRDIEDGSGSLVGPLVQDRIGRVGEDQEFSRRTRRMSSQNAYNAALLESLLSGGLREAQADLRFDPSAFGAQAFCL